MMKQSNLSNVLPSMLCPRLHAVEETQRLQWGTSAAVVVGVPFVSTKVFVGMMK